MREKRTAFVPILTKGEYKKIILEICEQTKSTSPIGGYFTAGWEVNAEWMISSDNKSWLPFDFKVEGQQVEAFAKAAHLITAFYKWCDATSVPYYERSRRPDLFVKFLLSTKVIECRRDTRFNEWVELKDVLPPTFKKWVTAKEDYPNSGYRWSLSSAVTETEEQAKQAILKAATDYWATRTGNSDYDKACAAIVEWMQNGLPVSNPQYSDAPDITTALQMCQEESCDN